MGITKENSDKVDFILEAFHQINSKLTVPEQVVLLTLWTESCVNYEEFEMAAALKKEMDFIINNPHEVEQRIEGDLDMDFILNNNPFLNVNKENVKPEEKIKKEKPSIYKRIINKIKRFFKWRIK